MKTNKYWHMSEDDFYILGSGESTDKFKIIDSYNYDEDMYSYKVTIFQEINTDYIGQITKRSHYLSDGVYWHDVFPKTRQVRMNEKESINKEENILRVKVVPVTNETVVHKNNVELKVIDNTTYKVEYEEES